MAKPYQGTTVWDGPAQAVEADMLMFLTEQGWRVLERFEVEGEEFLQKKDRYGHSEGSAEAPTKYRRSMFLLGYEEDSALAQADKERQEARDIAASEAHKRTEIEKAFEDLKDQLATAENGMEGLRVRREEDRRDAIAQRKLRMKIEDDMAKVIKAIGQNAYDAAVGSGSEGEL